VTGTTPRPTVLVLDDEKNIRKSIELALEQEGFQVLTAPDVSSALRTLHERIVEVLIIDIQLGEIDGIAFFRKTQADGFAIPAIFISGHATLTQAALAVKSGGFDFIEKPFTAEKIVVTVRRCLEMAAIKERLRLADVSAGPSDIVGESRAIKQVTAAAAKVAKCVDHRRKRDGQGVGGRYDPRAKRAQ
jgi:two-component system nitrogen regulation response regulator NtrX